MASPSPQFGHHQLSSPRVNSTGPMYSTRMAILSLRFLKRMVFVFWTALRCGSAQGPFSVQAKSTVWNPLDGGCVTSHLSLPLQSRMDKSRVHGIRYVVQSRSFVKTGFLHTVTVANGRPTLQCTNNRKHSSPKGTRTCFRSMGEERRVRSTQCALGVTPIRALL